MISYSDLYELLRKERFSESLQLLPKNFLEDISEYLNEKKELSVSDESTFSDSVSKTKKQFENSIALFKELILRRKKKLLNLVFVAAETGIMKRDYENMLSFERELFDKLVKAFEESDKEMSKSISAKKIDEIKKNNKLIIFNQNIEPFVDMSGNLVGPFASGELANLEKDIAGILVSGGKASFVDESA